MALTRVQDILLKARDTLADPDKERWSDARLIRLIDEGQLDIAKQSMILKGEAFLIPVNEQVKYTLPTDTWLLTRATYNGCKISLKTHAEMDKIANNRSINNNNIGEYRNPNYGSNYTDFGLGDYCWELDTGSEIAALIYDRRNMSEVKSYPIPLVDTEDTFTDIYGVVTSISGGDYTFSSDFGIVTSASDPDIQVEIIDQFGVVVGSLETEGIVKIWYVRMPNKVTQDTDELEIPEMWDTALKHYVIFNAFDDDYDSRFAAKSQKASALYDRELSRIEDTGALDSTMAGERQTSYRGAFDQ